VALASGKDIPHHESDFWSLLCTVPMLGYCVVQELIQLVAQRAGNSSAQPRHVVSAMRGRVTERLPSPGAGRIREQMREGKAAADRGSAKGVLSE